MLIKLFENDQAQLIRAIAQNTDDVIYAKDTAGRFTFANPAALQVIGRPLEDVLGRTDAEVLQDAGAASAVMENDRRILEAGEPLEVEELVPQPDGTPRWWSSRKMPFRDAGGQVVGLLGISRDITERKRIDAEREELMHNWQLALAAARMGWWRYDLASNQVHADPRCAELFGFSQASRSIDEFLQVMASDDRAAVSAAAREWLRSHGISHTAVQFRILRSDGRLLWLEAHAHGVADPSHPDRSIALIGTVADITSRKSTEEALRETNAQLRDADRQKDEFIATLAHELRNPLAPLRTYLEILRSKDDDPLVSRTRAVMDRQITHLGRLVDDLLDVSRITRGAINLRREMLDLSIVAASACEPFAGAIAAAGIHFECEMAQPGPLVRGDDTRLAQCLTNLLSNAVKFTEPGGRILVRVSRQATSAVIQVQDSGQGIAPDKLERIFELFVQDQPSGLKGNAGLGIGLALTRKLVELHGGTVRASSRGPGLGSEFRIELPLAGTTGARSGDGASSGTSARATVLVVDDNVDAADALHELLTMAGYTVFCAHTGQAALDAMAQAKPHVVLLDIGLPDIDGYEVCRRARALTDAEPALVAVTGWGQESDKQRALAAGFRRHLTKPADPVELLAVVAQLARVGARAAAA